MRVARIRQLVGTKVTPGMLPVSEATVWRWVAAGKFPRPFKLAVGTTVWNMAEVEAFIAAQKAATQ